MQSELFGHERGAYTGAARQKPGLFEVANGGTLFLDEIGDVPLATQVKLLRVLEASAFRHVGGTHLGLSATVPEPEPPRLSDRPAQRSFADGVDPPWRDDVGGCAAG